MILMSACKPVQRLKTFLSRTTILQAISYPNHQESDHNVSIFYEQTTMLVLAVHYYNKNMISKKSSTVNRRWSFVAEHL